MKMELEDYPFPEPVPCKIKSSRADVMAAFKLARANIGMGRSMGNGFICLLLHELRERGAIAEEVAIDCSNIVQGRLDTGRYLHAYHTCGSWLRAKGIETHDQKSRELVPLLAYRQLWLDKLAEEFTP